MTGDVLELLIPQVFGGGMRDGPESNRHINQAIRLDPKNATAYVTCAVGYYFTPAMFGGSKQKAIEIEPSTDAAATAHIWLARADLAQDNKNAAGREIQAALKIDPDRALARQVKQQIAGADH